MKPSVYLSRRVPAAVVAALERLFTLTVFDEEHPPSRGELLAGVAGKDGICTMLSDRVDDELLDAAGTQLRVVANYAVGYDNVDVDACSRRGVLVANTPGVLTEATAELTMALLLDLARRIGEGDRMLRRREDWIWSPTFMLGSGLGGKMLGIVGLGRIGARVAQLAEAFGMRIVYTSRSEAKDGVRFDWLPFDELLRAADIVTLHCPLTPETRYLIGADELRSMPRHALLVNTTRGPVVDEQALVSALRAGEIAGAALDVFEHEPSVHPGLLELENVVLAPHLGSATRETREAMGMLCVQALRSVLVEGRCPDNAVNASVAGVASATR